MKVNDIGDADRVDVILTNPPFGGEEEKGIQGGFTACAAGSSMHS